MAVHEQRLTKLRAHLRDAHDELHALPDEERTGGKTGFARLDEVIGYAGVVLEGAEAALVSTGAFAALQSATCTISNNPRAALRAADGCADALLEAVAMLPSAGGRDLDQEVQRVQALSSDVDQCASALAQQLERQAAVERKLADLDQALAKQRQAHDEQLALLRHEAAESTNETAVVLQAELDEFRSKLTQARQRAFDEVEGSLAEIKRMETESAALVGSIGLAGAAELYHEQGRRQRRVAEILRGLTVLTALAAVGVAVIATVGAQPTFASLVAYLFASLLLAGLAGYLALQSERHRARERHASALYLDLVAFSPFIEALPPEQRAEERVILTRKLFATTAPGTASPEGLAASAGAPHPAPGSHASLSLAPASRPSGSGAPEGSESEDRQNGHVAA